MNKEFKVENCYDGNLDERAGCTGHKITRIATGETVYVRSPELMSFIDLLYNFDKIDFYFGSLSDSFIRLDWIKTLSVDELVTCVRDQCGSRGLARDWSELADIWRANLPREKNSVKMGGVDPLQDSPNMKKIKGMADAVKGFSSAQGAVVEAIERFNEAKLALGRAFLKEFPDIEKYLKMANDKLK